MGDWVRRMGAEREDWQQRRRRTEETALTRLLLIFTTRPGQRAAWAPVVWSPHHMSSAQERSLSSGLEQHRTTGETRDMLNAPPRTGSAQSSCSCFKRPLVEILRRKWGLCFHWSFTNLKLKRHSYHVKTHILKNRLNEDTRQHPFILQKMNSCSLNLDLISQRCNR